MFGIVITWLWVLFLCAIVLVIVWIVQAIHDRRPPKRLKIPADKIVTYPGSQPTPIRKAQVPQADPQQAMCQLLHDRILGMVYHDKQTATRLIERTRSNYPGKSDKWVLEKVILDLERDRRL
ncbi:hypothetical protein ACN4EK_26275 [Pantanalinema rosaneae CENA516]|uniref:hypothetical protein n=1 Tax=Pantanalinema rosaneae TaxID=1620701 RepID=UPI003D6F26C2